MYKCAQYKLASYEMDLVAQVQIWDEAVCLSLYTDAVGKGINLSSLPAMGK